MTAITYRAIAYEVHQTDVVTLAAQLDQLEDVPGAAWTAADLRHAEENVSLDDAAAIAIVLALIQHSTDSPDRVHLGELGYRLRALRRGLEDALWPQAAQQMPRVR